MVIFNNKGCFLSYKVIEKIAKNEALNEVAIDHCLYAIKKSLKKMKLPMPKKIIIHRDGKVHNNDISILVTQLSKQFGSIELDVLEVIKSGYPVIANFINNEYHNLKSGEYWILPEKKYAILITNVQADQKGLILNPIIIKQKHGTTDFGNLVEQLYWFTKIYTNNLFNSTRLPATTERANNFVSTSNKEHRSTYLA